MNRYFSIQNLLMAIFKSSFITEHFQKYKTTTLHMVESLKLVDMEAIDLETASEISKR